ncbi:hypothetical protein D3C80_944990 [compost metagenome]
MHADDAADRARSKPGALRAFKDLDPLHVDQEEVRIGRAVIQAQVAEVLSNRGLQRSVEGGIRDAADEELVAAGPLSR